MRYGFLLLAFASLILSSGCSQGLGDRCESDSDCASGLTCSHGGTFHICENPGTAIPDGGSDLGDARRIADAGFVPDGGMPPTPDAPVVVVIDAPIAIDAPIVVVIDAPIGIDAPLPDAPDTVDAPVAKR